MSWVHVIERMRKESEPVYQPAQGPIREKGSYSMAAEVDERRAEAPDEDNPAWTAADFATAQPFSDAFPVEMQR